MVETTAWGAAFLAGLNQGIWKDISEIRTVRESDRIFKPKMSRAEAEKLYYYWLKATERASRWEEYRE